MFRTLFISFFVAGSVVWAMQSCNGPWKSCISETANSGVKVLNDWLGQSHEGETANSVTGAGQPVRSQKNDPVDMTPEFANQVERVMSITDKSLKESTDTEVHSSGLADTHDDQSGSAHDRAPPTVESLLQDLSQDEEQSQESLPPYRMNQIEVDTAALRRQLRGLSEANQ